MRLSSAKASNCREPEGRFADFQARRYAAIERESVDPSALQGARPRLAGCLRNCSGAVLVPRSASSAARVGALGRAAATSTDATHSIRAQRHLAAPCRELTKLLFVEYLVV
jgi:hypothetical protein